MVNERIKSIVKKALKEDIQSRDITTSWVIPPNLYIEAVIYAKEEGILCGTEVVKAVFKGLDSKIAFEAFKKDGDAFENNEKIIYLKGKARSILTAERVSLNFLSLLSGISTAANKYARRVKDTGVKILDTRKTKPNLRELEKYAVKMGGGYNHRKSLADGIIIKDNHLRAERFIYQGKVDEERLTRLISRLKKKTPLKVEIEVETLAEFESAIKANPDIIMLDNFSTVQIRQAVDLRDKSFSGIKLEVSGGVNLDNVREIAETGVDFISIGNITHSPRAIDFSLEVLEK